MSIDAETEEYDFYVDPMYEFFDSIIKTSVLEILIKLIIFKDYATDFVKQQEKNNEEEIQERKQTIMLYENTIRQFILSVQHLRNTIKAHLDTKELEKVSSKMN